MSRQADYWATRELWLDPRSEGHEAKCRRCGHDAVLVTLDGSPVRAYHPFTVRYDPENPCPALVPIGGSEGAPLSSDVLPENVEVVK